MATKESATNFTTRDLIGFIVHLQIDRLSLEFGKYVTKSSSITTYIKCQENTLIKKGAASGAPPIWSPNFLRALRDAQRRCNQDNPDSAFLMTTASIRNATTPVRPFFRLAKEMIDDPDAHYGTVQRNATPLSCVSAGPPAARIPDADSLGL